MSEEFDFPEIDEIGIDTLDAISFAPRFNRYMYDTISPHCKGKILEVGCGIGNISDHFIKNGANITLSDIRDNYIESVRKKYKSKEITALKLDLVHKDFDNRYKDLFNTFDSIFALNVVEHIKDDSQAIVNAKKLLTTGGKLIILVPAYQFLYNSFDKALEHFRRYNRKRLVSIMDKEFTINHSQYFNAFGILGWIVSGGILRKKTILRKEMELYDNLIWVAKTLDKCVFNKIGLSVIAVGQKA